MDKSTQDNMEIKRASGITASEKYLNKLCDKTFLRLWSYPGVFRDQSGGKGSIIGKEISDILVVFENHVIIFSDKYCIFPDTGDIDLDWSRWLKRAIFNSADQIFGAERWIRTFPDRIFIDRQCKQKFPLKLPTPKNIKIHRVIVSHGSSERCKKELGGTGSMMINTSIVGNDHFRTISQGGIPFAIGKIDCRKGYIHVLDDITLDLVMSSLNTISDFTNYLERKENLIEDKIVVVPGEEELLGYYQMNLNEKGEHDFIFPDEYNAVSLSEGYWEGYKNSPERASKIQADEISFIWDELIEEFSKHIMQGTQYYYNYEQNNPDRALRCMARETRTRRRILSKSLSEIIIKSTTDTKLVRVVPSSKNSSPYYVFLLLPLSNLISYEEYREIRRELLESYCEAVKVKFPDAKEIVGFATESGNSEFRSEDVCYLDATNWTDKQQESAEQLIKDLQLLTKVELSSCREYEYPFTYRIMNNNM